ncbi:MAG TPA: transporter [Usitatibacter sp.]|nr:transporter [Usitatibacter sp.]
METRHWAGAVLCALAVDAHASCGSAFCLVNTDWSAQGAWTDEGLRADLHYEYIDLDQPRHGRDAVAVGEIRRHHDEVETKNRNWVAAFDWTFAPTWGVSLSIPYVDRDHLHIHNHHGERIAETWHFRELGDARVQVRHVMFASANEEKPGSWGVSFGVKLPTGKHDVANGEGEVAERTLQPGTGTTDALLGVHWNGGRPLEGWTWFARAQAVLPMNSRDGFKPGRQLLIDAGARYAWTAKLGVMLQANYIAKGRDSGAQAEPDDSGQRQLFVSPGISFNVTPNAQLYAFVQAPVYQAVNGVQLTADWSALAGASLRF